jgi:leucyl aminopeptidase
MEAFMNIDIIKKLNDATSDNIIIPFVKKELPGKSVIGSKIYNIINEFIEKKEDVFSVYTNSHKNLIFIPIEKNLSKRDLLKTGKKTADYLKKEKVSNFALISFESILKENKKTDLTLSFLEGFSIGLYSFEQYKSKKTDFKISDIEIISSKSKVSDSILNKKDYLEKLIENIFIAKNLVNTPPADLTPINFAQIIKNNESKNFKVEILDENDLKKNNLNLIYTVGKGSENRPHFVKITYKGNPNSEKNIALVGKGVTFDSGGTNLKPSGSLETMKMDMAGAATVFAVTKLAADLNLPLNINTYIPLVENTIGYYAYRPGDILKSASGKTIEVLNTDAEGRLILADALHEATKTNPDLIIDVATLTGACIVALGSMCAAVFSNDVSYSHKITGISQNIYEDIWPLPLFKDYESRLKGENSDLTNIAKQKGEAGSTTAALFLQEFIDNKKWIHLDIAGPAFVNEAHPVLGNKATGFGVRLLINFLMEEFC